MSQKQQLVSYPVPIREILASKKLMDPGRHFPESISDKKNYQLLARGGFVQVSLEDWIKSIQSGDYLGIQSGNYSLTYFRKEELPDNSHPNKHGIYFVSISSLKKGGITSINEYLDPKDPSKRHKLGSILTFNIEHPNTRGYFIRPTSEYVNKYSCVESLCASGTGAQIIGYQDFDSSKDEI